MQKQDAGNYTCEISYTLPPDTPGRYLTKGDFVFTAYGCALLERNAGKSFVYTAVNLTTGRTEALCRAARQLDQTCHPKLAAKIRASSVRGAGRYDADKNIGERLTHRELSEILTHIFTEVMPRYGYVFRENQLQLSAHMLDAITSRGISLAESEVGTGKTLAYLTAAVLAKRGRINDFWLRGNIHGQSYATGANMGVIVATSSIALQRAIATDYIPELSRILMDHDIIRTHLICAVRKGKEHYICEKRLLSFHADADAKTKAALRPLLSSSASCDLADSEGLTPYMKRQICVAGGCVSRTNKCRYYNCCRYISYLDAANDPTVDFQITNHNYFLADVLHRTGGKRPLFPDYQMVIIDEAHKFLPAARQMYGLEMSDKELPTLAESVHSFTDGKSSDGINVHRLAKKLVEQSDRLFAGIRENVGNMEDYEESGCYPAVMDVTTSLNMKNIAGTADSIIKALENSYAPERFQERKKRARWDLESVMNRASAFRNYANLICWVEDDGEGGETFIRAIPKDLAESLYADVWNMGVPMILTSGTLSASGDFTRTKQTLGIDRVPARLLREVSLPSPFDFKRNARLYFSKAVPVPDHRDKRYISAVADEVERLILASCGHAAVLFTSYNVMGQVYAILSDRRLSFPMFQMGRKDTTALERFKQSGGGVLFASGSLWEGIDIPGDALSMLIIVKLPFTAPDPIGDYEKSLCGDMGEYMRRALLPDMLVKLKQGFGRLIRTETDTGICAILDCRANPAGNYHHRVLTALPPCGVTTNISDIEPFLRSVKAPVYFGQIAA